MSDVWLLYMPLSLVLLVVVFVGVRVVCRKCNDGRCLNTIWDRVAQKRDR